MPQPSKLLKSRDEWKSKAVERATEIRELKQTKKRHLKKIAELKRQCCQSEWIIEEKKHLFPAT